MEKAMKNGNGSGSESAGREQRLQIMLSETELEAIDTFRFAHRMPSRAAAVRELFRVGLAAVGTPIADVGVPSRDYGVLGGKGSQSGIRK
jgi:hypothetical protein